MHGFHAYRGIREYTILPGMGQARPVASLPPFEVLRESPMRDSSWVSGVMADNTGHISIMLVRKALLYEVIFLPSLDETAQDAKIA